MRCFARSSESQNFGHIVEELFARTRQRNPITLSPQQRGAEFIFQAPQRYAERGLLDPERLGG